MAEFLIKYGTKGASLIIEKLCESDHESIATLGRELAADLCQALSDPVLHK